MVFDRDAIIRSAEARAKLYALTLLVEGPGCIRWEDGNGFRLKDTDQWVQFYCLVKSMQNFTFRDETQSALDALRGEVERLVKALDEAACELSAAGQALAEFEGFEFRQKAAIDRAYAASQKAHDANGYTEVLTKESP